MQYRIRDVSKLVGLSRSTLLYYERIGLIKPGKNSQNDYRIFLKEDVERLKKVCTYRDMGVPLAEIKTILDKDDSDIKCVLEKQLININDQINKLRNQQNKIFDILKIKQERRGNQNLDKATWIMILRKSGLDDEGMENWHREFEDNAPEVHQNFLESLGLTVVEIRKIRKWSKE